MGTSATTGNAPPSSICPSISQSLAPPVILELSCLLRIGKGIVIKNRLIATALV